MAKNPKIDKSQKRFIEALKNKFIEDTDPRRWKSPKPQRREQIDSHVTLIPYAVRR